MESYHLKLPTALLKQLQRLCKADRRNLSQTIIYHIELGLSARKQENGNAAR